MSDVFTLRGPIKKDRPALVEHTVERKSIAGAVLGKVNPRALDLWRHPQHGRDAPSRQGPTRRQASGTQSTKTRKEVRGGGKKPFHQKGTGGARQGTIRAPHYPGGGIALGPKPRSYEQKTPKKMIRLALYSALSDRAELERVALIDSFDAWTTPKTKGATTFSRPSASRARFSWC